MILLFAQPDADGHVCPPGHPERPARIGAVLDGVDAAELGSAVSLRTSRPATRPELLAAHSAPYLDAIEGLCASGGGMLDADTFAARGSWDTALLAAGAGIEAVGALDAGQGSAAFIAMRPPGHHATATTAMGFCLLNNIAVTAAHLAARGERVLVYDWDVHHGNGTQDIFWNDPSVLYISTHQSPLYPGTGGVRETGGEGAPGLTVNIPLPPGTTGDVYRRALDSVADPVVARFSPTWVLVSAGYDAHRDDPLASIALSAGDFADLSSWVMQYVPVTGRLVLFLEGGYDARSLGLCAGATLARLAGTSYVTESPTSGGPGNEAVAEASRVWEERQ